MLDRLQKSNQALYNLCTYTSWIARLYLAMGAAEARHPQTINKIAILVISDILRKE